MRKTLPIFMGSGCRTTAWRLFDNSLKEASPRTAEVEGRRAAGWLFDTKISFDLNMGIAQILRNGSVVGASATLTGRSAAGAIPHRPGKMQPVPSGHPESSERSQFRIVQDRKSIG